MKQAKILVVDDSLPVVKAISMKLKSAGYEVISAGDGAKAVNLVRQEKPDLILQDIDLSLDAGNNSGVLCDGFLIIQWLRRLEETRNIPIIVFTGGDPVKLKERSIAAGADGFFHKSLGNDELLEVIRRTLEESCRRNDSPAAPAV